MKKLLIEYENSYIEYKLKDNVNPREYVDRALNNPFGEPIKITIQKYPLKNNPVQIILDRTDY